MSKKSRRQPIHSKEEKRLTKRKQRREKAGGKLGGPPGGLKGRHLPKAKRAQWAKKRLLRCGAVRAAATVEKPGRVGGQGVEAEAACSGEGERRRLAAVGAVVKSRAKARMKAAGGFPADRLQRNGGHR